MSGSVVFFFISLLAKSAIGRCFTLFSWKPAMASLGRRPWKSPILNLVDAATVSSMVMLLAISLGLADTAGDVELLRACVPVPSSFPVPAENGSCRGFLLGLPSSTSPKGLQFGEALQCCTAASTMKRMVVSHPLGFPV